MSLIEEGTPKQVRMANLAVVGSHSVNGVAALHTELLQNELFNDFFRLWPGKFNNKTNGVTPRRWIMQANPELGSTLNEVVGPGWITDADELQRLELVVDDAAFRRRFREIKRDNKERLAEIILRENGLEVDPSSMFDVQVKRIHEYKRQLLDVLFIVHQYLKMKADPSFRPVPRTWIFAGKAAPGYVMAKWIIKLVNSVAAVVNGDPAVRSHMKVVFLRNYRVSLAERIFPAADLSEQISTAGKEASGTGNMKFAMNGALTIGTLDGANVEIREAVGPENFFLFGLTVPEVRELKRAGYNPWDWYRGNPDLRAVVDAISGGTFSPDEPRLFQPVVDSLLNGGDSYLVMADFAAYVAAQELVSRTWVDYERWTRMSILNVARSGRFSSDRTIREYAEGIWKVGPIPTE
jgi:starch phosphorylase